MGNQCPLEHHLVSTVLYQAVTNLLCKGCIVNILGFRVQLASVTNTQICSCNRKAAIDHT